MLALHRHAPVLQLWDGSLRWLGLLPVAAGLAIASWHARLFRRRGTNIDTFGEPGTIVREGMFRRTRNPMYLGFVITLSGLAACLGSLSPFLAVAAFKLLVHHWYIRVEERAMLRKFGQDYLEYQRTVPRWL
ncbi:MAG TPA: isoprenylcysteine carboxylmethyltransferase family protein [Ramlibacter sp.]|nr:isoprenylcysteine carboxylmethyltransferase family protein [Ramlibacter sp.]